ncbi:MAG TPA: class I SAM-dependent methyltransferase [Acidimicrobiales bacterium]
MTFALTRTLRADDFDRPDVVRLIGDIVGGHGAAARHRKNWEFAVGVLALEAGGVLHDDAVGLSVAAGHEAILYYLANRCRRVFATDLYGSSDFKDAEASSTMLTDPDVYAPYPYRRGRLHVSWMDALDLRFDDDEFDFVVSFGSIEHFGQLEGAARALAEMARVVRPGGIVFVTTEQPTDGLAEPQIPSTWLMDPDVLLGLVADIPSLELFGGTDFIRWPAQGPPAVDFRVHSRVAAAGLDSRPHLGLLAIVEEQPRTMTSVSLALRKVTA